MPIPKLIINGRDEFPMERRVISIGRAPDNSIPLSDDSNVSRYHAEIEMRDEGEFWLFDLNSSNGTTLNGEPVVAEKPLADGDSIVIGGSAVLEVVLSDRPEERAVEEEEEPEEEHEEEAEAEEEASDTEDHPPEQKKKVSLIFILAGLLIGLAVISVGAAIIVYLTWGGGGSCDASASIVSPQNGDIINSTTPVQIEVIGDAACVARAVLRIEGTDVATAEAPDFQASLDPAQFTGFADGLDHKLTVVLVDADGNEIPRSSEIALNFDPLETESESPTPSVDAPPGGGNGPGGGNTPPTTGQISVTETKSMAERVLPQFSGRAEYVTGNPQFLDAVNRLTTDYAVPGFFQRAAAYRDVINTEFIQERSLDPPIGYILAMSRSRFVPLTESGGAGLWRIDNALVQEHGYNGLCGSETIANQTQNCAAIASSSYLKDILLKVFDGNTGDIIYVVAAFGMSPLEAEEWKESLPADRKDFWRILQGDPKKQEEVARFFAAAIVAENPERFGLKDDRRLSELYREFLK